MPGNDGLVWWEGFGGRCPAALANGRSADSACAAGTPLPGTPAVSSSAARCCQPDQPTIMHSEGTTTGGGRRALSCGRELTLVSGTMVYPGHGPLTTIGREQRSNPFLS